MSSKSNCFVVLSFRWLGSWTPRISPTWRRWWEYCNFRLKCSKNQHTNTIYSKADTCFILFFWLWRCSWDSRPPEGREALTRRIFWIPLLFFCPLTSLSFCFQYWLQAVHICTFQSRSSDDCDWWEHSHSFFPILFFSFFMNCYSTGTMKQAHVTKVSLLLPRPEQETRRPAEQDRNKVKQRMPVHVCQALKSFSVQLNLNIVHDSRWTSHQEAFLAFSCPLLIHEN